MSQQATNQRCARCFSAAVMARTLRRVRADKSDSRLRSGSLAYKCMPLAGVPVVLGLLPCLFAIAESDIATVMESFDLVIVGAGI